MASVPTPPHGNHLTLANTVSASLRRECTCGASNACCAKLGRDVPRPPARLVPTEFVAVFIDKLGHKV